MREGKGDGKEEGGRGQVEVVNREERRENQPFYVLDDSNNKNFNINLKNFFFFPMYC
jgi:hypothetical protein